MSEISMDTAVADESMNIDRAAQKTERSHEENQERAYVAASRRADRTIEARVQSALKASEIHKNRTGKGFKITKEIVAKEDIYEEDNDLPRSYRLVSAHMETPSADTNTSLESFLSNKAKMSQMMPIMNTEWRENEIHRLFAQYFPNAAPATQQFPLTMLNLTDEPRTLPNRRRSRASVSPTDETRRNNAKSTSRPSKMFSETSTTGSTLSVESTISPKTLADFLPPSGSTFTTELSFEAHTFLDDVGSDALTAHSLAGHETQQLQDLLNPPIIYGASEMSRGSQMDALDSGFVRDHYPYSMGQANASKYAVSSNPDDDSWKALINESIWTKDQQM